MFGFFGAWVLNACKKKEAGDTGETMATYVLGDIHGQHRALELILEKIGFDATTDHLWLVGDLVARGPDSLGVLRRLRVLAEAMGERFVSVLGNHDLRLLVCAAGLGEPRGRDGLEPVLAAPDRDELIAWLIARRLWYRRGEHVLVHAGLPPTWSLEEAASRAVEVEAILAGAGANQLLADWHGRLPVEDPVRERRRLTLAVLTGIRTCTAEGELCASKGPPEEAPEGCLPWFYWHRQHGHHRQNGDSRHGGVRILFGHWAALGLQIEKSFAALDSGAAWGGRLTALRLEDDRVFGQPVADGG